MEEPVSFRLAMRWTTLSACVALVACSLFAGDDTRWDTDVPKSAPVRALLGTWGPDGDRIAFIHTPDTAEVTAPFNQLWIYHLERDTMRRVTSAPLLTPNWSPNGERFVFHSDQIPQHLFTVGANGKGLKKLTGPDSPNPNFENTVIGKWSPSGDRILFSVEAGDKSGVYTMNADGSELEKLVGWSVQPAWFPSGERIAYIGFDSSSNRQIFVADDDGTNQRQLTDRNSTSSMGWPSVSPGGEHIAFSYKRQVYLMNTDGNKVRQVTGGNGYAKQPVWSPDGEEILFWRRFFEGAKSTEHLYLLDVETLDVAPVFPATES